MFHYEPVGDPALQVKLDRLDAELRKIGLYVDVSRVVSDGHTTVAMVDALIGDVAYSARVQDPEQHQMDTRFREMVAQTRESADDVRADLLRRLGRKSS